MTEDISDEDWIEFTSSVQSDFIDLSKEMNLLEERLMKQRMRIWDARLELEGKEVVMDDNNEKKVAMYGGQSKVFVLSDLSNSNGIILKIQGKMR
jgi:uncharacterized glyoxalase superfamily protein PhnB